MPKTESISGVAAAVHEASMRLRVTSVTKRNVHGANAYALKGSFHAYVAARCVYIHYIYICIYIYVYVDAAARDERDETKCARGARLCAERMFPCLWQRGACICVIDIYIYLCIYIHIHIYIYIICI